MHYSRHNHHHLFHIPAILGGHNHSTMGNGIGQIYAIFFTSLAKGFCHYTSTSNTRIIII